MFRVDGFIEYFRGYVFVVVKEILLRIDDGNVFYFKCWFRGFVCRIVLFRESFLGKGRFIFFIVDFYMFWI